MPARLVQVTLVNNSSYPIRWVDDGRPHGDWQEPWYPSNLKDLKTGEQGTWRLESSGIFGFLAGVEGWALFMVDVPFASNVGVRTEFIRLNWERAFLKKFHKGIEPTRSQPDLGPSLIQIIDHEYVNLESSDTFGEFVFFGSFVPVTVPVFFYDETNTPDHVWWMVEVRDAVPTSTLPLTVAAKDVLYAITGNGDLMWARHIGHEDGTFRWETPMKHVGIGWGEFKHVFSDGDGIIYVITPIVEAGLRLDSDGKTHQVPASGGDLMWARHVGREDGTFRWESPLKKVGTGWGGFKQVFSGGDGIIYVITPIVEAGLRMDSDGTTHRVPASGGDLMWARHVGREDGSFIWEGPLKKVGAGWGEFKQIFSGGDGIIYVITPIVEAGLRMDSDGTTHRIPASGGDLMWARHVGHEDGTFRWESPLKKVGTGWGGFKQVFSGGDGIIYVITPIVEAGLRMDSDGATHIVPASGGDLMWARHVGWKDGSFRWESPLKKVGTGWGGFKRVFSGGD